MAPNPATVSFASNCLLLYHRDWDHHAGIRQNMPLKAEETDRPIAALIKDLK